MIITIYRYINQRTNLTFQASTFYWSNTQKYYSVERLTNEVSALGVPYTFFAWKVNVIEYLFFPWFKNWYFPSLGNWFSIFYVICEKCLNPTMICERLFERIILHFFRGFCVNETRKLHQTRCKPAYLMCKRTNYGNSELKGTRI